MSDQFQEGTLGHQVEQFGITGIDVSIAGYDDEGGVCGIELSFQSDVNFGESELAQIDQLKERISDWAADVASEHLGNYYDGDGGAGTVTLSQDENGLWSGEINYDWGGETEEDVSTFEDHVAEAADLMSKATNNELDAIKSCSQFGVASISLSFRGRGDEGDIDEIEVSNAQNETVILPTDVEGSIADIGNELIEKYLDGYENNSGGGGEVTLNFANGVISSASMSAYYIEPSVVDSSTHDVTEQMNELFNTSLTEKDDSVMCP